MELNELQNIFKLPEHKLLRLSDTRWLSFESVASRIIEQWPALQQFFVQAQLEQKCKKTLQKMQEIQDGMSVKNQIYLKFLAYILNIMNKLNLKFQSESSQIIYLITCTKEVILQMYTKFLKKEYLSVTDLECVDYKNVINVKDVSNIYKGHDAEITIINQKISDTEVTAIKSNILNYYQTMCDQILYRINIKDKRLKMLRYFDPMFIKSPEDINYINLVI